MSQPIVPHTVHSSQPGSAFRIPRRPRITWRMVLVIAAASFVLFYPIYNVLEMAITHGIHRRGDLLVVDLQAMSNFEMDQTSGLTTDIPASYRALDGKRVMLAGEMYSPDTAAREIGKFQLVYSITRCCFTGPPKVQHFVNAVVSNGKLVKYSSGIVNVTGILHVGVERSEGQIASIYRMDVERVDP